MAEVPVITIDGPSGSGKGTVSRVLAQELGWRYLDSGALYRAVGLAACNRDIALDAADALVAVAENLDLAFELGERPEDDRILLDGQNVSLELRGEACAAMASKVAAVPAVREALLGRQRRFARAPGLIADGRDMGTTVFPDAALKVFLTASAEKRAKRRLKQLKEKGISANIAALSREIRERDARDAGRAVSPLRPAADAVQIDTSDLAVDQVLAIVQRHWSEIAAD